jgi:hypothetical protein
MNTPTKLTAFAAGLVAVFGAALGLGNAVGPVGPAAEPPAHEDPAGAHGPEATSSAGQPAEEAPAGLMVSDGSYTLALAETSLPAGPATPLRLRILGPDGAAVTAFEESHDEELHLIAVRRDLTGFQHVHPALDASGTWTVPLALTSGSWRVFADFVPSADGENRTLGADLAVPGELAQAPLPAPSRTAEVDGYTVTLGGDLSPGHESLLTLHVRRDGVPVTDLQPYLGAFGHLVVLRAGDLAYLHVHPAGEAPAGPVAGPAIEFMTTAPSEGTYRLFLDFKHGDTVRTAAFTVSTGQAAPGTPTQPPAHGEDGHDD